MASNQTDDTLSQLLIDDKISGKSYLEISQKHGIPVDEVIKIVRNVYMNTTITDPQEYRALLQLRLEKIISLLWDGLEKGSFKHGEAVVKAVERLTELHDLNQKTMTVELKLITDSETLKIIEVLNRSNSILREKIDALPLDQKAKKALVAWPEWVAEATTSAVEQVIYAEPMEDEDE